MNLICRSTVGNAGYSSSWRSDETLGGLEGGLRVIPGVHSALPRVFVLVLHS